MLSDPGFRELVSLPLSAAVLQGLARAGYTCVSEVVDLDAGRLVSICKVSSKDAQSSVNVIRKYWDWTTQLASDNFAQMPGVCTAWNLLQNVDGKTPGENTRGEVSRPVGVVSMCRSFDEILGGGFPTGRLTELCGQPGVGKTQFCIQTCLTVQLPKWFGGLAGQAIFIDTEGNFIPRRAEQMAEALVAHCRKYLTFEDGHEPTEEELQRFTPSVESLMSGIHYIRVTDHLQLMVTAQRLRQFCSKQATVRLIVLDSIALPFRYDFEDIPQRNRLLASLAQNLLTVALENKAAVILTNQITTRIESKVPVGGGEDVVSGQLVPALGESWGHICSVRVFLSRNSDTKRRFKLLKHPGRSPGSGFYRITSEGIRDCVN
ncbi:DNA repair protein RAD51 like protein 3 [Fasciola hepatica]|uniref:DNA repair protein RAD51 homolog 3 n=1 Tax=Fasciola hepatica TaxID=6192 RepID=A0A4E0RJA7_FASHE|nr:DNA repair protein RAD51 like protein 3 [Fasciola hepatica]